MNGNQDTWRKTGLMMGSVIKLTLFELAIISTGLSIFLALSGFLSDITSTLGASAGLFTICSSVCMSNIGLWLRCIVGAMDDAVA